MAEYKIERVKEDDPWRCQVNIASQGQCRNKATVLGGTCPVHGGNKAIDKIEATNIRNYRLAKWQTALNRHAEAPRLKSLHDEVAILRMMLEEQLNKCQDTTDLIMQSHLLSDLVMKIEKVVKSCHNLESAVGQLMDKQDVMRFANNVIEIIGNEIQDEAALENISTALLELIESSNEKPVD